VAPKRSWTTRLTHAVALSLSVMFFVFAVASGAAQAAFSSEGEAARGAYVNRGPDRAEKSRDDRATLRDAWIEIRMSRGGFVASPHFAHSTDGVRFDLSAAVRRGSNQLRPLIGRGLPETEPAAAPQSPRAPPQRWF